MGSFETKEIENANLVIDHFGYWPEFHDSEIISITLERTLDKAHSSVKLRLYAFEATKEIENGYSKLIKHCFIDFEFLDIINAEFDGFNHQNAIQALEFGKEGTSSFCNILGSYGVDGYIEAKQTKVVALKSFAKARLSK